MFQAPILVFAARVNTIWLDDVEGYTHFFSG